MALLNKGSERERERVKKGEKVSDTNYQTITTLEEFINQNFSAYGTCISIHMLVLYITPSISQCKTF
mgnify:CR=1 FL=1